MFSYCVIFEKFEAKVIKDSSLNLALSFSVGSKSTTTTERSARCLERDVFAALMELRPAILCDMYTRHPTICCTQQTHNIFLYDLKNKTYIWNNLFNVCVIEFAISV